jgi:hypothetical protein
MTKKPTALKKTAIEIMEGLDHISIWNNRDPDIKRIKQEFVMEKITDWYINKGDCD